MQDRPFVIPQKFLNYEPNFVSYFAQCCKFQALSLVLISSALNNSA